MLLSRTKFRLKIIFKILLAGIFLFVQLNAFAQKKFFLVVHPLDSEIITVPITQLIHLDSVGAINSLKELIFTYHQHGNLLAGVEGLFKNLDTLHAYLKVGPQFKWAQLQKGNVPEEILSSIGYREKVYQQKIFISKQVEKLEKDILNYSENNGYPFATIKLDSVNINKDNIKASLVYDAGPRFLFDSVSIIGSAKLKTKFLASYLKIFPGRPYDQQKVNSVAQALKQLPFLTSTAPTDVIFKNEKAYILIYADQKKSNQFDGIIGFAPNQNITIGKQNKVLITGEVNFQLKNLFNSAKSFSFSWKQFKPQSPFLNVQYIHPNLFRTPLEVGFQLNLLKQDSTFLNILRNITFSERLSGNQKIGVNVSLQTSSPLGSNAKFDTISHLPDVLSTKFLSYGAQYLYNTLNDLLYPTKGWDVQLFSSVGTKSIIKSAFINEQFYNGLALNSVQAMLKTDLKKYFFLKKRSVVLTRLQAGKIWNENLFQNELFRLGGLNSLRGFNENSFFVSEYYLSTLEYRLFIDKEAYLFTFFDYAGYKSETKNNSFSDKPFGAGMGISFSTPNGIFNFAYASGKSVQQSFGLNFSKIHFGYTNRF